MLSGEAPFTSFFDHRFWSDKGYLSMYWHVCEALSRVEREPLLVRSENEILGIIRASQIGLVYIQEAAAKTPISGMGQWAASAPCFTHNQKRKARIQHKGYLIYYLDK